MPSKSKRLIGNSATRRWALILLAAILVCGGWICFHYGTALPPARTYRVGFENSPPRQYVDSQGRPYGSITDLIREAARRADVKLEWVFVPEGPDRGLSEGIVDLWPVINQLPERSRFHFTEPYAQVTYWLVSKGQERALDPDAVAGRVVGITPQGLVRKTAEKSLPQARFQVFAAVPTLIEGVCSGTVFAAVIADSAAHATLFRKPEGCELRMSPIPGGRLWTGIASSPKHPDAARVADLLRDAIGAMVQDGTFSTISLKWVGYPTNEAAMVESLTSAHRQAQRRTVELAVLICLVILLLWMAVRLRVAHRGAGQAIRAAETANSFLRTLIERLPEFIYAKDNQGRFLFANSSVAKMMGAPAASDLLGKTDFDFYPKGLAAKYHADEQRILQTGEPLVDVEEPSVDSEGRSRWLLTSKVPFPDGSGKVIGLVGVGRDITERKRMAEALELHAEKLARSNAELERFAYVASHDLQEPLRMVASFTQLLSQRYSGKLDETADRYINFAVDGAKRMQQLIADLLAYSRVNSKELDLRQTGCEAVVTGAMRNLQAAIEESGASVDWDPLPALWVDQGQLTQLFQNLLGNAIKFRRNGEGPRIHVSAADSGAEWMISVQDNGIGIDPRHADGVFQIFQRLHTRQEYPGTGIGLAVCKKVVERHGGRIWVESQPGAGSNFRFTLPKTPRNGAAHVQAEQVRRDSPDRG